MDAQELHAASANVAINAADAAQALVLHAGQSAPGCNPQPADDHRVAASGVMALPKELLDRVVSFICSKHDLAQLCQTNHGSFASAMPLLYHSITIPIHEVMEPITMQMLTVENTGLNHIKDLVIVMDETIYRDKNHNALAGLAILVNRIPQNQLRSFTYTPPQSFPHRVLNILWQRQRNLQNVEILPAPTGTDFHEEYLLEGLDMRQFPCIKSVRTVPYGRETARMACVVLRQAGVTQLEVDGMRWKRGDARLVQQDGQQHGQQQTVEDPLTECLFSHVAQVAPGCVANFDILTSLTLKDLNLTLCKHTWFTFLELSKLKDLRLEYCPGADLFLIRLSSGAATPGLQSLQVVHDVGGNADRTIHAIEDLLIFPQHKMENLKLSLRNADRLPSMASILSHSRSLKRLLLDVEAPSAAATTRDRIQNPHYDAGEFRNFVQSCRSLVELGIAFPPVDLDYERHGQHREFFNFVAWATSTVNLATLNIVSWPLCYKPNQSKGHIIALNLQLARLASDIFHENRLYDPGLDGFVQTERKATLQLIAFGVREKATTAIEPAYFVQCEQSIPGRKSLKHALGVDLPYLRGEALDIGILDYHPRDFNEFSRRYVARQNEWGMDHDDEDDD